MAKEMASTVSMLAHRHRLASCKLGSRPASRGGLRVSGYHLSHATAASAEGLKRGGARIKGLRSSTYRRKSGVPGGDNHRMQCWL